MAPLDTRAIERDSMFLMVDIALAGPSGQAAGSARVRVRNLSEGGMMVEGDFKVVRGQEVVAELRNIGTVAGTVAWVRGNSFGVAFAHPIDPKLARTQVFGGHKEAPVYARAAIAAPRHDGWNGKMRRV